jgi:centromeric protein E
MARTPGTPASKIERMPVYTPGGSRVKEEKIFVTVRVRPPNDTKDETVWECTNSQTIQYRGDSSASYTFGRILLSYFMCVGIIVVSILYIFDTGT